MLKKFILCSVMTASIASPAFAFKNWEIQSTSYGTEYTYWCNEGQTVKFSIGHNISAKQALGFDTIDQYLAAQGCT